MNWINFLWVWEWAFGGAAILLSVLVSDEELRNSDRGRIILVATASTTLAAIILGSILAGLA